MQLFKRVALTRQLCTTGFNDNASGITVVIETATALMKTECFVNEHTIIFVLFDAEETGCIGSLEFVRSFLIPDYIDNLNLIQGAIIIDSVMNWDAEPFR